MEKLILRLAIQKNGRLTEETIGFLKQSGLEFEISNQRLYSYCKNFPLKIIFIRDDDIPFYVKSGVIDLGIVGQNILYENGNFTKYIIKLNFGLCSLSVAVPKRTSVKKLIQLKNARIATSYPNSTTAYFKKRNIPVRIITVKGSVEITPALGVSDAIVDLVGTGRTLKLNDLRVIEKIYDSQAVVITEKISSFSIYKKILIKKLLNRFRKFL